MGIVDYRDKAIAVITAQQEKEKGRTAAWMVGEQLKDICRREPMSAELIVQDMANDSMHIQAAEKAKTRAAAGEAKILFGMWQSIYNQLKAAVEKLEPETGEKLRKAMQAQARMWSEAEE